MNKIFKKIKNYQITMIVITLLFILSFVVSLITDNELYMIVTVLVIVILEAVLSRKEKSKFDQDVIPLINSSNFDKALEYLKEKENKYFFNVHNKTNAIYVALIYAFKGELEEARVVIEKHNLYRYKDMYYILFQIALFKNDHYIAMEYAGKINSVKNEKFKPQQEAVKSILKMIDTKVSDEEILRKTKYPFIRELCLKYQNNENIVFEYNNTEPIIKIEPKKRSITWLGIILLILSIVALYSLLIAMVIVAPTTNTEITYFISQNFKYAFILMLIPIGSIIFGFIYRKKGYGTLGNIIVGFVSLIFLFAMGILSISFDVEKTQDVAVLNNIYPLEEASLPKDVVIYTIEEEYYRETFVRFNNHIEFNNFYNSLEKRWKTEYNFAVEKKVMEYLGSLISLGTDYYILYSATLDEYNINHIYLNQYYVFIQIDIEDQSMIIKEICVLDYE